MLTQLEMEVNDLCGLYVLNKTNRITISDIRNLLCYKEPILFNKLRHAQIRKVIHKLFPCHLNNKKNTKYFKISNRKVHLNIFRNSLIYRDINTIKLTYYGINETYFENL